MPLFFAQMHCRMYDMDAGETRKSRTGNAESCRLLFLMDFCLFFSIEGFDGFFEIFL